MYQGKQGGKRPYKDKPARQAPETKVDPDILSRVVETGLHDEIPPMRWLIEGAAKTGKSTLAAGWPGKVLFADIERGLNFILGVSRLPVENTGQIVSLYNALKADPRRGGYRTIVFDTLDKLFDLYALEVSPSGALGIQEYQPIYRKIIGMFEAFRRLGLHVVGIAHEIRREDKATETVSFTCNLPGKLGADITALVDHIIHTAVDAQGRFGVILRKNAKFEAGGRLPGVPAFRYLEEGESLWVRLQEFYAAHLAGEHSAEGDPDPFVAPERQELAPDPDPDDEPPAAQDQVVAGDLEAPAGPPATAPEDEKLTDSRPHTEAATIILPRQETPPPAAPPERDVQAELAAHNAKARELREREDAAKAAAIAVPAAPAVQAAPPPPPAPAGAQGSLLGAQLPPVTVPGKLWARAVEFCRGDEARARAWLKEQTSGKTSEPAKMPEPQAAAILAQVERCLAAGTHYGELAPRAQPPAGKPRVATMAAELWKALLARYAGDEKRATDWLVVNTGRDDLSQLAPKEARQAKEQLEAEIHDEEQLALEEAARADAQPEGATG